MKAMTTNARPVGTRARKVLRLGVLGLLLALIGDRGAAVIDRGIDPLEVLDLQVKPNVIVVLDSSGSMRFTVGGDELNTGDHPRAKMYQAKQVLKTVIADNAEKATFLFGQYTQDVATTATSGVTGTQVRTFDDQAQLGQGRAGDQRFQYTTNNFLSPSMATNELYLAGRGVEPFMEIKAGWNLLYFNEAGTNCTVTIPVGFYSGTTLAAALEAGMEGCAGSNLYTVSYVSSDSHFNFVRQSGTNSWTLRWSQTVNSIGRVLNAPTTDQARTNTSADTNPNTIQLLRRGINDEVSEPGVDYDGDGDTETVINYRFIAGRVYNGETIKLTSTGTVCGIATGTATNPPTLILQEVQASCGANQGSPVLLTFAGALFTGNTESCDGFQTLVPLVRCDQTSLQLGLINPFLQNELVFDTNGVLLNYGESTDGIYRMATTAIPGLTGGIKADGATPIANSLRDIRNNIWGTSNTTGLWGAGQGPVTAIKDHTDPKEKTIVLFVTDGDDTCADADPGGGDDDDGVDGDADEDALAAAYRASLLYTRLDSAQAASSITTYVVGFGSGASTKRLNWIAWGGSGLGQGASGDPLFVSNNATATAGRWTPTGANVTAWTTDLAGKRTLCSTCIDAFVAPDAETLAAVIQNILDQGATAGEFTAQQSVTDSIFEWVAEVPGSFQGDAFSPDDPDTRFVGIVPTLFRSSFTLPGFNGQLKAFTNEAGTAFTRWEAGQVMRDALLYGPGKTVGSTDGLAGCFDGPSLSGCVFSSLTTRIKRRIYTTSSNGVFPVTTANYFDATWLQTQGNRATLWPPVPGINPSSTAAGVLDNAMGLYDLEVSGETEAQQLARLKAEFGACEGTPLPAACTGGTTTSQLAYVRKEAREITLAYTAGAEMVLAANGDPERGALLTSIAGQILYKARAWILGDSTLGDAAVAPPALEASPEATGYGTEYELLRDGPRATGNIAADGTNFGLGLRNPDQDDNAPDPGTGGDGRTNLKPAMTVVYLPANDMLHAFRAGPSEANATAPVPPATNCTRSVTRDCGGEELWGFVPFDQLEKLRLRLRPQTRFDHTFMLASAMRFADVFVPNGGTTGNLDGTTQTRTIGSATTTPMKGVWRRLIFFGRGQGGKYISALDVTTPGPYTRTVKDLGSNQIIGPVPLWNRGNPDTSGGSRGGANNNSSADLNAYAKMGETWSTPAISRIDKLNSTRKGCPAGGTIGLVCATQTGGGVEFVAFVGSGYGETASEGSTFYTLDALTGDVVAAGDITPRTSGVTGGYTNALVADAVSFNIEEFVTDDAEHPMNAKTSAVYIGDLHGRIWKFAAAAPGTPILFADLGANQPIGTAVSLLNLPPGPTGKPHVFVATGNDTRASDTNLFKIAGYRDDGTGPGVELFVKDMPTLFRGTVQPASAFAISGSDVLGRVFFGGTRFVPPPPTSTLSTPIATSGVCRSRFDSVIFAVGAETGLAAFDLNASGSDDFMILDNSRIAAVTIIADTTAGGTGSVVHIDEGLASTAGSAAGCDNNKPTPKGTRPTVGTTSNVDIALFRSASSVCPR